MYDFEDENIKINTDDNSTDDTSTNDSSEKNEEDKIEEENLEETKKPKAPRIKIKFTGALISFFVCFVLIFVLGLGIFSADFSYEKKVRRLKDSKYKLLYNEKIKSYGLSDEEIETFKKSFTIGELVYNEKDSNATKKYYDGEIVYRPSIYKMRKFKINDIFQVENLPKQKIEVVKGKGNYAKIGVENKQKDFTFELNDIFNTISSFYSNGKKQIKNEKQDYYLTTESIDKKRVNRYKLFIDTDNLTYVKRQVNGGDKIIGVMPKGSFSSSDLEDDKKLLKAISERISESEKIIESDYIYYAYNNPDYPALKFASLTISRARSSYGTNDFLINTLNEIKVSKEYYEKRDTNATLTFYEEDINGEKEELVRFQVPKNESMVNNISFCDKSVATLDVNRWIDELNKSLNFLNTQEGKDYIFSNWYIEGKNKMDEFGRLSGIRVGQDTNIYSNFIKKVYQVKYFKSVEAFEKYKLDPTNSEYAPYVEDINSTNLSASYFRDYNKQSDFFWNNDFLNKYYKIKHWSKVNDDNTTYNLNNDTFGNPDNYPRKLNSDILLVPKLLSGVVYKFFAMGEELTDLEIIKYHGEKFNYGHFQALYDAKYKAKYEKYDLKAFINSENNEVLKESQDVSNASDNYVVKKYLARWKNRPYTLTFKFNLNDEEKNVKVSLSKTTNENNINLSKDNINTTISENSLLNPILYGFYFDNNSGIDISFDDDNVKNFDVNLKIKEYKFSINYIKRNKENASKEVKNITVKFGQRLDNIFTDEILNEVNNVLSWNFIGFSKKFENTPTIIGNGSSSQINDYYNGDKNNLVNNDNYNYEFYKSLKHTGDSTDTSFMFYARYEQLEKYNVVLRSEENNVNLVLQVERKNPKLTLDTIKQNLENNNLYYLGKSDKQLYAIYEDKELNTLVNFNTFNVLDNNTEIYLKYLLPVEYKFYNNKNETNSIYSSKFYLSKYYNNTFNSNIFDGKNPGNDFFYAKFINSEISGLSDIKVQNNDNFQLNDERLAGKSLKAQIYWKYFITDLNVKNGSDEKLYTLKIDATTIPGELYEHDFSLDEIEEILLNEGLHNIFGKPSYENINYAFGVSKIDGNSNENLKLYTYKKEEHTVELAKLVYEITFKNQKTNEEYKKEYSEGDGISDTFENSFEYIANLLGKNVRGYETKANMFKDYYISDGSSYYATTVGGKFKDFNLSNGSSFSFAKFKKDEKNSNRYIKKTETRNKFKITIVRPQIARQNIDANIYRIMHNVINNNDENFSLTESDYIDIKKEPKTKNIIYNNFDSYDFKSIFGAYYNPSNNGIIEINNIKYKLRGIYVRDKLTDKFSIFKTLDELNNKIDIKNKTYLKKSGNNFSETLEVYFLFYKEIEISYNYAGKTYNFKKFPEDKITKSDFLSFTLDDNKHYEIDKNGDISQIKKENELERFTFAINDIVKGSSENLEYIIEKNTYKYNAEVRFETKKRLVKFSAKYQSPDADNYSIISNKTKDKDNKYYLLNKEYITLKNGISYLNIPNIGTLTITNSNIDNSNILNYVINYELKKYELEFLDGGIEYSYSDNPVLKYQIPYGLKPSGYIGSIPNAKNKNNIKTDKYTTDSSNDLFDFEKPINGSIKLKPRFVFTITILNEETSKVIDKIFVNSGENYTLKNYDSDKYFSNLGKIKKYYYDGNDWYAPHYEIRYIDNDITLRAYFEKPQTLNITVDGKDVSDHPYIKEGLRKHLNNLMAGKYFKDDYHIDIPKSILNSGFTHEFKFLNFSYENLEYLADVNKFKVSNEYDSNNQPKIDIKTKYNFKIRYHYDDGDSVDEIDNITNYDMPTNHINYAKEKIISELSYNSSEYVFKKFRYNQETAYHEILSDLDEIGVMEKAKINTLDVYYSKKGKGTLVIDYYIIKVNKSEDTTNFNDYEYIESSTNTLDAPTNVNIENYPPSTISTYYADTNYTKKDISNSIYGSNYSEGKVESGKILRLAVFYSKRKKSEITFHYKDYNGATEDTLYKINVENQMNFNLKNAFNLLPEPGYELWNVADIRKDSFDGEIVDVVNVTSSLEYYVSFNKKNRIYLKDIDGNDIKIDNKNFIDTNNDCKIPDIETNDIYKYKDKRAYYEFSHWSKSISSYEQDMIKNDTVIDKNITVYAIYKIKYRINFMLHTEYNTLFKEFNNIEPADDEFSEFTKKDNFKTFYNADFRGKDNYEINTLDVIKNLNLISDNGFDSIKYGKKLYHIKSGYLYKYKDEKNTITGYYNVEKIRINAPIMVSKIGLNDNNEYINQESLIPSIAFVHRIIAKMYFNGMFIMLNSKKIHNEFLKEFEINKEGTLDNLLNDSMLYGTDFIPKKPNNSYCSQKVEIKKEYNDLTGTDIINKRTYDIYKFTANAVYELTFFKS